MSNKLKYRQITCQRVDGVSGGTTTLTSWVPFKFATIGNVLKLTHGNGNWLDGWQVISVGDAVLDESELPHAPSLIRNHRRNTGDSELKARKP